MRKKITDYEDGFDWQQWEKRMYRIYPAPPKLELDEYIERYRATGDVCWFLRFLDYYEPSLNRRTQHFLP